MELTGEEKLGILEQTGRMTKKGADEMKRSSGILMPIFSLPSRYGIGTLGRAAYEFVDFLEQAGQSWWQILPVGHTSYGDSPYQCFSTFAGNPYFVDLDLLVEDGLLKADDLKPLSVVPDPGAVDYNEQFQTRYTILRKAAENGKARDAAEVAEFVEENHWVEDYALFMALKNHFDGKPWVEWEDRSIRLREPEAVERYRKLLCEDIWLYTYIQFLFFRQWEALRAYAAGKGVGMIGDLPIYVAMDSADVWAESKYFQLDENNFPSAVAGVPPDYFSEDGQLWGNPLYNWETMKEDGFGWWIRRVDGASKLYDVIRIDHFRGFESYWAVPYGETTAKNGEWIKGPGMDLVGVLTGWFPNTRFIAEDLGVLTDEVQELLSQSGLPGMKILEFAFGGDTPSSYLPHVYERNCVCYPGTHDNTTLAAWLEECEEKELEQATEYFGLNETEGLTWGMLRGGMSSVADLFVAQIQDYLGLDGSCRVNTPGMLGGNWQWRLLPGQLTTELADKIAHMTKRYGRN